MQAKITSVKPATPNSFKENLDKLLKLHTTLQTVDASDTTEMTVTVRNKQSEAMSAFLSSDETQKMFKNWILDQMRVSLHELNEIVSSYENVLNAVEVQD